jgi:hypothetical protein
MLRDGSQVYREPEAGDTDDIGDMNPSSISVLGPQYTKQA